MELVDLFPKTIAVAELQSLTPEVMAKAIELIDLASGNEVPGDGRLYQRPAVPQPRHLP